MRLGHLNTAPAYDELYHILAAESWLADGSFTVYKGEYTRVPSYTILTAWMFDLAGGPDLAMARAPNVFLGALLAMVAALWTRQVAGPLAGWIMGLCVLFWPSGIHLSQTIRFYALHGVLFFIGAVATYGVFRPEATLARRLGLAVIGLAALWAAKQLQNSTLVGVLGLGLWVLCFVVSPAILRHPRRRALLLAGGAALSVGVVAVVMSGALGSAWERYITSPWGWDPTAYHRVLSAQYPLFWTITPILAILALRAFPRPAGFCTVLVGVGLLVHSFAGMQNIRYIYYISPFVFALWAMGLAAALPGMLRQLRLATSAVLGRRAHPALISATVVGTLCFAMLANDAVIQSMKLALGRVVPPASAVEDWSIARDIVQQHVADGALVVATNELAAIHYLGGFDVVFSQNWMQEMEETEFAHDPRTGRYLIRTIPSLGDLVQSYPEGIFLASRRWWSSWPAGNDVTTLLQAFQAPDVSLSFEQAGPLRILHWRNDNLPQDPRYARIRQIIGPTMADP